MTPRPAFAIHPAAVEEAEQAVRWYRERSARASEEFREEIDSAIEKVLEAPHRWPAGPTATSLRPFRLSRSPTPIAAPATGNLGFSPCRLRLAIRFCRILEIVESQSLWNSSFLGVEVPLGSWSLFPSGIVFICSDVF
jgi:hypothetical protein